jgi:ornithine carrier protein
MVAEVFEYPFDLAKVRLQAQLLTAPNANIARFDGPLHCLTQTWKEEGVRGLYRVRLFLSDDFSPLNSTRDCLHR